MTTASGISVEITKVRSLAPYGFFVQWVVRKPHISGAYRFWLYRSGSSNGPWEPVAEDLTEKYCAVDRFDLPQDTATNVRRPNQLALFRQFYYRVVVLAPNGERDEYVKDIDPPLLPKAAQHYRRAMKNFEDMLRLNGQPCAVLKRKRWGERCPKCSDAVLREGIKSACVQCWGTGFLAGFWNPVLLQVYRANTSEQSANTPEQRSDTRSIKVLLPNVPDVERDDILVFLRDRRRFLVEHVVTPEIMQNDTHQTATASELPTNHIIYRYPVSDDAVASLV